MSGDPGDLANMADLALPAVVSFWPPAAGIWILGCAALATAGVAAGRAIRRYRADAYLRRAEAQLHKGMSPAMLSETLKRAAILAFGREPTASLTGSGWAAFLERTGREGRSAALAAEVQVALGSDEPARPQAVAEARDWLAAQRGHLSARR